MLSAQCIIKILSLLYYHNYHYYHHHHHHYFYCCCCCHYCCCCCFHCNYDDYGYDNNSDDAADVDYNYFHDGDDVRIRISYIINVKSRLNETIGTKPDDFMVRSLKQFQSAIKLGQIIDLYLLKLEKETFDHQTNKFFLLP